MKAAVGGLIRQHMSKKEKGKLSALRSHLPVETIAPVLVSGRNPIDPWIPETLFALL